MCYLHRFAPITALSSELRRNHKEERGHAIAVAAVAACVLLVSGPAEARVIYTPVTVAIENSVYNLDLNNDGIVDFAITESNTHQPAQFRATSVPIMASTTLATSPYKFPPAAALKVSRAAARSTLQR